MNPFNEVASLSFFKNCVDQVNAGIMFSTRKTETNAAATADASTVPSPEKKSMFGTMSDMFQRAISPKKQQDSQPSIPLLSNEATKKGSADPVADSKQPKEIPAPTTVQSKDVGAIKEPVNEAAKKTSEVMTPVLDNKNTATSATTVGKAPAGGITPSAITAVTEKAPAATAAAPATGWCRRGQGWSWGRRCRA